MSYDFDVPEECEDHPGEPVVRAITWVDADDGGSFGGTNFACVSEQHEGEEKAPGVVGVFDLKGDV